MNRVMNWKWSIAAISALALVAIWLFRSWPATPRQSADPQATTSANQGNVEVKRSSGNQTASVGVALEPGDSDQEAVLRQVFADLREALERTGFYGSEPPPSIFSRERLQQIIEMLEKHPELAPVAAAFIREVGAYHPAGMVVQKILRDLKDKAPEIAEVAATLESDLVEDQRRLASSHGIKGLVITRPKTKDAGLEEQTPRIFELVADENLPLGTRLFFLDQRPIDAKAPYPRYPNRFNDLLFGLLSRYRDLPPLITSLLSLEVAWQIAGTNRDGFSEEAQGDLDALRRGLPMLAEVCRDTWDSAPGVTLGVLDQSFLSRAVKEGYSDLGDAERSQLTNVVVGIYVEGLERLAAGGIQPSPNMGRALGGKMDWRPCVERSDSIGRIFLSGPTPELRDTALCFLMPSGLLSQKEPAEELFQARTRVAGILIQAIPTETDPKVRDHMALWLIELAKLGIPLKDPLVSLKNAGNLSEWRLGQIEKHLAKPDR